MADDFQVKQSSSSSGAYGLVGGAIGAGGTAWAANHFTKPKYGSYEDIIAESKDSFDKKIEKADAADKQFLEDAKALNSKRADAEAEYHKKIEEYKKSNGFVKEETEAYKNLVKAEEEANTALTNKKNELINREIERLKNAGTGEKTATINKALKHKVGQIAYATKRVNELQAAGASKEEITKATAYVEALQKEAKELAEKIAEKLEYGKLTDEALAKKKAEVAKIYELNIQDRVNQELKVYDTPKVEPENVKLSKSFLANRKALAEKAEALKAAENEVAELTGINIAELKKSVHGSDIANKKINTAISYEQRHLDKLNILKKAYAKVSKDTAATGSFSIGTLLENLKKLGTPGATFETAAKDIETELTKYLTDTKGLSKEQQEAIRKLVNGEINEKTIQEAIDKATSRIDSIKAAGEKAFDIEVEIEKLNQEAQKLNDTMNKKGVYVREKDGVVIDKKTGKPAETPVEKLPKEKAAEAKLPKGVKVPEDTRIEYGSKAVANLSEEELKQQAEAAVKEEAYKAEAEAAEAAKKARETAYGELKDGVAKSDEEIQKEVNKLLDVESKAAYADKQVEASKKEFVEKYAEKMKRKWGFAEHTNWKIAGAAAAGAIVLGAVFSAFAPKNK